MKKQGIGMAVAAFTLYITGGIGTFVGLGFIILMNGRNFMGMGDGRSMGYLFFCVGISLSIMGVLLMRIFRNRGIGARH